MSEEKRQQSVLERATSHYKTKVTGELESFEVPEWETTIYFRNVQSLKSEAEIVELTRQGKSVEALVMSIINKARNQDGSLMFSKHDKNTFLNEVDPQVVLRIANQLNTPMPALDEVEKNSTETQTLDS